MTRQTHKHTHIHIHTQTRSHTLIYQINQSSLSHAHFFDVVKSSNLIWWGLWRALSLLMNQLMIRSSAEEIHWFFHLFQVQITYKREITWLRSFKMEYVTLSWFYHSLWSHLNHQYTEEPDIEYILFCNYIAFYSFDIKSTVPIENLHTLFFTFCYVALLC